MRINSMEIFQVNSNGTFTVSKPIKIGGVFMKDVVFSRGVKVGNIDLTGLVGKDLEVQMDNGVYIITGYYERT